MLLYRFKARPCHYYFEKLTNDNAVIFFCRDCTDTISVPTHVSKSNTKSIIIHYAAHVHRHTDDTVYSYNIVYYYDVVQPGFSYMACERFGLFSKSVVYIVIKYMQFVLRTRNVCTARGRHIVTMTFFVHLQVRRVLIEQSHFFVYFVISVIWPRFFEWFQNDATRTTGRCSR